MKRYCVICFDCGVHEQRLIAESKKDHPCYCRYCKKPMTLSATYPWREEHDAEIPVSMPEVQ
jgi:hypothetical protein